MWWAPKSLGAFFFWLVHFSLDRLDGIFISYLPLPGTRMLFTVLPATKYWEHWETLGKAFAGPLLRSPTCGHLIAAMSGQSVSLRVMSLHPHIYTETLKASQPWIWKLTQALWPWNQLSPWPHICFLTQHHPSSVFSVGGSASDGVDPWRDQKEGRRLWQMPSSTHSMVYDENSTEGAAKPKVILNCCFFSYFPLHFPSCGINMGFSLSLMTAENVSSSCVTGKESSGPPLEPYWIPGGSYYLAALRCGHSIASHPSWAATARLAYLSAPAVGMLCLKLLPSHFFYLFD